MFHPVRDRAERNHQDDPGGRRTPQADAGRVRFAVGAAPARRESAALSPPDSRAEAVLQRPQCTVLLLDDMTSASHDLQVQSIAHGVVRLEQLYPEYGAERRRLIVLKYRGVRFRGGYHDFVIQRGGLEVYPRLVAAEHRGAQRTAERLASGIARARRSCSAAASNAAPARSSSARRAPASRRSPRSSSASRGQRRGSTRRCSSSTRACTRCSRAPTGLGIDLAQHVGRRARDDPAGRSGRAVARRVRPRDSRERSKSSTRRSS